MMFIISFIFIIGFIFTLIMAATFGAYIVNLIHGYKRHNRRGCLNRYMYNRHRRR